MKLKTKLQNILNCFVLFILVGSFGQLNCQSQGTSILLSELIFEEGIYSNYEEFKNNNPSKKYMPVVLSPGDVNKYLAEHPGQMIISSSGQYIWVGHFKENGEFVRIPPDSIWGFSKDNKIVIKHDQYLVNMTTIGAICYYSINDALFAKELKTDNENQYIFEYETGKVKRFKRDVILSILSNDMELYQQFLQQDSYKKMRESMFEYVLMYNERNPIHFPE